MLYFFHQSDQRTLTIRLYENKTMEEAKIRKELGLLLKSSKQKKVSRDERLFSWSPWPTKYQLSRYPYAPIVTMALGLFFFMWGFELNS